MGEGEGQDDEGRETRNHEQEGKGREDEDKAKSCRRRDPEGRGDWVEFNEALGESIGC